MDIPKSAQQVRVLTDEEITALRIEMQKAGEWMRLELAKRRNAKMKAKSNA